MFVGFFPMERGRGQAEELTVHPQENGSVTFWMNDESFDPAVSQSVTLSPDDVDKLAVFLQKRDRPYLEPDNG